MPCLKISLQKKAGKTYEEVIVKLKVQKTYSRDCSAVLQEGEDKEAPSHSSLGTITSESRKMGPVMTGIMPALVCKGYGDIMKVETSGASQKTAQQDKLGYSGVRASHTMAQTDAGRMNRYKSIINNVGHKYGIEAALIAAIISRESRAGNVLKDGWGDSHNAWGLMQVDVNPHGGGHTPRGAWNSEEHLCQGTEILVHFIERIQKKFPGWTKEQQLKGGIAAYNKGDGNVQSYDNVDARTTGGDYSNDVVARAQWYKNHGGFNS